MPEQPSRARERLSDPMPRTLWWSRTTDGITLEVRYGIRIVGGTQKFADLDAAREAFRELMRKHKVEEVREGR